MNKQIQFLLVLIAFLSTLLSSAQTIQNVKASPLQNGKITVTYDIVGAKPEHKFLIDLYGSNDNFSSPLIQVTGDVGKDIFGGPGKRIVWSASEELSEYKGEITFRVKGNLMALPFNFKFPVAGGSVRRGKMMDVKWEGGNSNQNVKLELYKGSERIAAITETKNSGAYSWNIPKNLSKGTYTMKLTAGSENVISKGFAIKPKVPLFLKVLPILVVGGAVAALGGGGGGGAAPKVEQPLPAAPGPN